MTRYFLTCLAVLFLVIQAFSQSFGIRAGLNYTKFGSPLEQGVTEKYSLANGFHFGINYAYKFADKLALRGEFLYTQIGTNYEFHGESFYKVPIGSAFVYERGKADITMKVSNAYISIPLTFQWQMTRKLELSAGVYGAFLIGPRGNGTIYFEKNKDSLFFKQSLIHNYNKDKAGGISSGAVGSAIYVDGKVVVLARDAGAYYNYLETEKAGKLYNFFDFGLTGSLNYFINKGFYFGVRYNYGLLDITNNKVDYIRNTYDKENNRFLFSNDFDRNLGLEFSFGFRF
jgi:hypothetical protein